jgi:GNAT superfamily N-acetyltransferase
MEPTADNTSKNHSTREYKRFYKLFLIVHRVRHGLILHSFFNLLLRVGISVNPYWIDVEGLHLCTEPKMKDDAGLYRTGPIEKKVVIELYETLHWNTSELRDRLESDYQAIGLFRQEELAAFMLMRFQGFYFKGNRISLEPNEAYLENMYTYEDFRGRSLAPYLRYQAYTMLAEEGKTLCYSITQYFNKSSRKFKAKLNAEHSELWLHLGLFGKVKRNFRLKKYRVSRTSAGLN